MVRLRDRFDPTITDNKVTSFNAKSAFFEASAHLRGRRGWGLIMERNAWFQDAAVQVLKRILDCDSTPYVVFAYSYAAREILRTARERGMQTVLGQIDPGPWDHEWIVRLERARGLPQGDEEAIPASYWSNWREECCLADRIIVNSNWSRQCLINEGIENDQIATVPLAIDTHGFDENRTYPSSFSSDRPLRLLFLGSLTVRKGIFELLEAAEILKGYPIEFWLVGKTCFPIPASVQLNSAVKLFGAVPRSSVHEFYRAADLFILPTHSDGFGLTQLEAQRHGLPIIASRYCGEVVEHERNGLLLDRISPEAISGAILPLLSRPDVLMSMSLQARNRVRDFSLARLQENLLRAV